MLLRTDRDFLYRLPLHSCTHLVLQISFFFLNIFFESTDVKPNVSAALESAVLIRLFEKIMSLTIPTAKKTGMAIKITSTIISLYKRIAINVCSLLL